MSKQLSLSLTPIEAADLRKVSAETGIPYSEIIRRMYRAWRAGAAPVASLPKGDTWPTAW